MLDTHQINIPLSDPYMPYTWGDLKIKLTLAFWWCNFV